MSYKSTSRQQRLIAIYCSHLHLVFFLLFTGGTSILSLCILNVDRLGAFTGEEDQQSSMQICTKNSCREVRLCIEDRRRHSCELVWKASV